jgi:hypothetical protein
MADTNEHTGARLVSKVPSKEFLDNYDLIFKKDKKKDEPVDNDKDSTKVDS